jgi:hypothetical protein
MALLLRLAFLTAFAGPCPQGLVLLRDMVATADAGVPSPAAVSGPEPFMVGLARLAQPCAPCLWIGPVSGFAAHLHGAACTPVQDAPGTAEPIPAEHPPEAAEHVQDGPVPPAPAADGATLEGEQYKQSYKKLQTASRADGPAAQAPASCAAFNSLSWAPQTRPPCPSRHPARPRRMRRAATRTSMTTCQAA